MEWRKTTAAKKMAWAEREVLTRWSSATYAVVMIPHANTACATAKSHLSAGGSDMLLHCFSVRARLPPAADKLVNRTGKKKKMFN